MADPIATVETIMRIAVAINKAVHKARKNIDDCKEVQTLVAMGSGGLKVLKEKGVTDRVPELSDALGHLKMTLKHALSIVEACQEDHNLFQRVVMADDLSNQLHHVKEDITQKTTMVTFAISAYMAANADHTGHQLRHHQRPYEHRSHETAHGHQNHKTPHGHQNYETPHQSHEMQHGHRSHETPHGHRSHETPHGHRGETPHGQYRSHETPRGHRTHETPHGHKSHETPHGHRGHETPHGHRSQDMPHGQRRSHEVPHGHRAHETPHGHRGHETPHGHRSH